MDIVKTVDDLGRLKAKIAALEKLELAYVNALKKQGVNVYEGTLFEAVVFKQTRTDTDWQGLAEKLGFTNRQLLRYQSTQKIVCCKVTARKNR
jgi:hypothetical protein